MFPHPFRVMLAVLMLAGCSAGPAERITKSFEAVGITKLVVRAAKIGSAIIATDGPPSTIQISGLPTGSARGFHSPDSGWRETPPERWGFDFVAHRFGDVLVVSTKNEVRSIHHNYVLDSLRIRVPASIEVVRQQRPAVLNADSDLTAP